MLLLDRQTGAAAQPRTEATRTSASTGRVQLRLRADGRVLELPPGKTTIGSSPRCNVRIEKAGVQPLHCLIVEGPEGLRVRNWVANTTLNGQPFEESALAVGDCLSLGRVELEVIDPQAGKPQLADDAPVGESKNAEQIRAGRDRARIRRRRLLDALRHERSSHHELCQQVLKLQESHLDAIAEQNEISGKLESSLAELAAARRQLGDFQSVETARQQLASRNEQLGFEIGELSAQINELKQRQTEAASDQQKIADDRAALQEQHRQLSEANNRLQSEMGQVANEKAAAEEQCRQLTEPSARLQIDINNLTNEKGAADEQCWKLAAERSQLQSEFDRLADEKNTPSAERRQLDEVNSRLQSDAVGKIPLIDQRDALDREVTELRVRVAQLSEENTSLATAKSSLAEEQARLIAEKNRLAEIEREKSAAVAGREDTSAELYRALLQIAEMQERDEQSKAIAEAYESLSKEHDHLHEESDQLKEQIARLSEERAAVEGAWQLLSAEATTLGESQQRLADDNAALVARLDEAREQLEQAQQEQATSASAAAELERERAAKLQAEAHVATAIADGERRLGEQERRFAEQAQQFAEQSRRIQELESQLAAAESRAATAAELAASRFAAEQAKSASHVVGEQSAKFGWSSARAESVLHHESNAGGLDGVTSLKSLDEAPTGEVAWDRPASTADAWHAVVAEVPTNDSAAERIGDVWSNASEFGEAAEEPNPWAGKVSPPAAVDAGTFGDDDDASLTPKPVDDSASSEQWSDGEPIAERPEVAFAAPVFAKLEAPVQRDTESETVSKPKPEPMSFIERYSHLLEEDGAAGEAKPERANEFAPARPIAPVLVQPEAAILPPANSEDEESIEQYMAKLLQRVRGDSEGGKAAREQPTRMPLNAPTENPVEESAEDSAPLTVTAPVTHASDQSNAVSVEPMVAGDKWQRRVYSPAPATNLGALRALANETARLAISRHELRKLRRKAVTKVIVSTLAGVTSVWLMLDSEDCRNMQFITACVALMVAVYWACETFRTLINSMRIKPYEGADAEATALPIDVEVKLS